MVICFVIMLFTGRMGPLIVAAFMQIAQRTFLVRLNEWEGFTSLSTKSFRVTANLLFVKFFGQVVTIFLTEGEDGWSFKWQRAFNVKICIGMVSEMFFHLIFELVPVCFNSAK